MSTSSVCLGVTRLHALHACFPFSPTPNRQPSTGRFPSSAPCGGTFPRWQCHQLKELVSTYDVIASQCAHWRGNPFPLQRPDFAPVTKEKTDCHVAALLAMTVVDGTSVLKLMTLPFGGRFWLARFQFGGQKRRRLSFSFGTEPKIRV